MCIKKTFDDQLSQTIVRALILTQSIHILWVRTWEDLLPTSQTLDGLQPEEPFERAALDHIRKLYPK